MITLGRKVVRFKSNGAAEYFVIVFYNLAGNIENRVGMVYISWKQPTEIFRNFSIVSIRRDTRKLISSACVDIF